MCNFFLICCLLLFCSTNARSCSKGQSLNKATNTCEKCNIGTYLESTDHTMEECKSCPRGKYTASMGQQECTACEPAKYLDRTGGSSCIQCRTDSYRVLPGATSASDCLSCNEAKMWSITENRDNGTSNVDLCICPIGRVDFGRVATSNVLRCQECPIGGSCVNNNSMLGAVLETLNSTKGYWRPTIKSMFYECLPEYDDCTGGGSLPYNSTSMANISTANQTTNLTKNELIWFKDFQCRDGNHGPLCAVCKNGWVRNPSGICVNCHGIDSGVGPTLGLLAGAFLFIFLVSSILMTCKSDPVKAQRNAKKARRMRKVMNQMKILLGFIQILTNMEGCLGMQWPGFFNTFVDLFSVVNLDLGFTVGTIDPCAFGLPFLHAFLFQASILPLFAFTVYLAFYSRKSAMRFMQKFAKTFKCCKIEVAGEATVHLANARRHLNDAIKKRDNFLNVFVNVETKLNKAIEVATLNQKENIEQTKQKVLKRKEEIEQARKDAGLPPKQENASNAMAAFVPPPPAAENAETAAGGKTDEEMQAAKKKVIELETANEVASEKEMEKTNRLAENLKEINDKLTESKTQKENEIESVKQVVEDAEWDVEDAETHVDELKIEAQASKDRLVFWINSVIFLVFPGLVAKIFKLFDCTYILHKQYLYSDLGIECWTGLHWWYVGIGVISLLIYVVGVPCYTYYSLLIRHDSLFDEDHYDYYSTRRQYGGVFAAYEADYWYWEVIEQIKKVLLTGFLIIVAKGSSVQILVAEVITAIYLLAMVRTVPYHSDADDLLQSISSICLLFTLMIVFALKTDDPDKPQYDKNVMGILLTILSIAVFTSAIMGISILFCPNISKWFHKNGSTCYHAHHITLEEEEEETARKKEKAIEAEAEESKNDETKNETVLNIKDKKGKEKKSRRGNGGRNGKRGRGQRIEMTRERSNINKGGKRGGGRSGHGGRGRSSRGGNTRTRSTRGGRGGRGRGKGRPGTKSNTAKKVKVSPAKKKSRVIQVRSKTSK